MVEKGLKRWGVCFLYKLDTLWFLKKKKEA